MKLYSRNYKLVDDLGDHTGSGPELQTTEETEKTETHNKPGWQGLGFTSFEEEGRLLLMT